MKTLRAPQVLLWPVSLVYGAIASSRAWLYQHHVLPQRRLKGVVISVGNLTVGGTGKTPLVIWLAERFLAEGRRVAILSRGYRGANGTSDEIRVMKDRLQGRVLFGVAKNRFAEGKRLEAEGAEIFLLDDGFQHLQLERDVDIVLIDATRPLHEEFLLPAGRLREPTSAVNRADLVLFTRTNHALLTVRAMQRVPEFPIFAAKTKLVGFRRYGSDGLMSLLPEDSVGPFFAFCGIGNAEAFLRDLQKWGVPVTGHSKFRDHHRYSPEDAQGIEEAAAKTAARALVTTEKDAQNFGEARFKIPVYLAVISLEIPDEEAFLSLVKSKLPGPYGEAA
jgi:tetraacyldisaccharide 4'-kinase